MPISLNPSIHSLILRYNQFHSVDASFNFYPELEVVDLSHNQLVSVPDRAFKSQGRLRDLRLNNNKISQLRHLTFAGLRSLESLDLRHNLVEVLPPDAFADLASLELLDLGKNRLGELAAGAFRGLGGLRVLRLDDNNLQAVPHEALADLASLAELHLHRNRIAVLAASAFLSVGSSLASLDLSGNRLERLHPDSLQGLGSLVSLRLHDNNLAELAEQALEPLTGLESLTLGQNRFQAVPTGWLAGLPRLRSLELNGCPELRRVEADAFSANLGLEAVSLAANRQLISLDAAAFRGLTALRRVDLSNNGLTGLASSLLPWWQLTSLQISGNPLHCDCANYFLKAVILAAVNSSTVEDSASAVRVVRCWLPVDLRDRDLALLDLDCARDIAMDSSQVQTASAAAAAMATSTTTIAAVSATAIVVVVGVVLLLLLRFSPCLKASRRLRQLPVKQKDILQYGETVRRAGGGPAVLAEPRYVSAQPVNKSGPLLLHHPYGTATTQGLVLNGSVTGPYAVNIVANPVQITDNFIRHEDYFAAAQQQQQLKGEGVGRITGSGQYYTIGRGDGGRDALCLYETSRDEGEEEEEGGSRSFDQHQYQQHGREPIYYAVSNSNDQSTTTLLKIDSKYHFRDPKSVL